MFYGIDLHTDSFKAAILSENSEELTMETVNLKTDAFKRFLSKLAPEDYIVLSKAI